MRRVTREASRAKDMAPPPASAPAVHPVVREVTEDTPPDLLEGTMDLKAILPSGKTVQSTVDRKTPMMDLLIHIATANKINPAGHIVQVRNERGIEMPYKPSTPIGALDTTTIEIVPKNRVNEYIIVKKPAKVANQPFETTFRLQVHLPRNQLYVMRVSPKALLSEIFREVCQEKNLDISKYEIRHPVNLDHKLSLSMSLGETGLQELTVVSKNSKINSSVSAADIIALKQSEEGRGKGLDGSFKHSRSSVGDSSVSSESTGSGRGISPCRSEDSRSISPLPLIRPKTLIHSRTASNLSTCSSSSGQCKGNTFNNSALSTSQVSHQQVVMQAPPRTKKRAAPQPPGAKVNNSNTSLNCSATSLNNSTCNPTCTTPTNGMKAVSPCGGGPLERPTPRKKEAPREPPKPHYPLSHHQSLPLNHHSRHNSGSNVTDSQQDIGPLVRQDSQQQLERAHPVISKMSSISSSMTNLTSVSSVSSTSLASSTGGSKKRRAPKPPVLSALKTPAQIEEESAATDSEASTLHGGDAVGGGSPNDSNSSSPQRKNNAYLSKTNASIERQNTKEESTPVAVGNVVVPDDPKEIEVLSASPVSSLSSPSNSASESNSSSPIPPSSITLKEQQQQNRSLNTNEDSRGLRSGRNSSASATTTRSHQDEQEYYNHHQEDESGNRSSLRSPSRSSSTPSSSSNHNADAPSPPHADTTSIVVERSSRNVLSSSSSATVDQDAQSSSCRPHSANTQVSSSSTLPSSSKTPSPSARTMPMPLPRRKAPPAPSENSSNSTSATAVEAGKTGNTNNHANAPARTKKISSERSISSPPALQKEHEKSKLSVAEKVTEREAASAPQQKQNYPMPKPRPRPDRKSVESIISQTTHVIKPQTSRPTSTPSSHYTTNKSKSTQSASSNPASSLENDNNASTTNTDIAMEQQQQPIFSGQLRNPLAKYGVKVLPDNVLKERADRLKKSESSADSIQASITTTDTTISSPSAHNSNASSYVDDHAHKNPIQAASKSSSDDFSDTGSITSLTKNHKISTGSIGRSGLASKPLPTLSKSDYTSQGSVRSIKQLTSAVASMSSAESANYNDDHVGSSNGKDGYESDNLEENLDLFEPANQRSRGNIRNAVGGESRAQQSSLTKAVSSPQRTITTTSPTTEKTTNRQNEKSQVVKTSGNKPRVFSSVSVYEDNDKNESKSPGVVSESGFGRKSTHREQMKGKNLATEDEDASARLNRWQNMVSLNEIENGKNDGGNMSAVSSANRKNNQSNNISDTNKPKVSTMSLSSSTNNATKQHSTPLLQGDYHQRTKIHLSVDESQNESATCHSSESEASYTDSGVPATETVTPSPVNLDDVILDHEYHHAGSHSEEKFSSEDGDELKNSSRRSSIQSDHSEEWMNILEAKMNKDEEAIEKMFEAVLPPGSGYTPSPTPPNTEEDKKNEDVGEQKRKEAEVLPSRRSTPDKSHRREILTDSEDDYYEGNGKKMENDDCKEMIQTTVQLHSVPVEKEKEHDEEDVLNSIENEDDSPKSLLTPSVDNNVTTSSVPIRKLSKSESFSHNSEFNEAKQRRKNFKSSRSNAMMHRSSQSSGGSATDLRRSMSLSDSEEEREGLGSVVERKFDGSKNDFIKQSNDRAVSMSDLSANKIAKGSMERNSDEEHAAKVQKATSLQKLSGESVNKDEVVQMDTYRKQLEMQFEQWKEEFMKQHGGKTKEEVEAEEKRAASEMMIESTPSSQVVEAVEVNTATEPDKEEEDLVDENPEVPQIIHKINVPVTAVPVEIPLAEEAIQQTTSRPVEEKSEISVEEPHSDQRDSPQEANKEEQKTEMKNTEFPPTELRKKKDAPRVVYQYAGPPTIKMASWGDRPVRAVSVKQDRDYIMGMGQNGNLNAKTTSPARPHSFQGAPIVNVAQSQQSTETLSKAKRESSPSPSPSVPHIQVNKGWSAAINAPNVLPNSKGTVKSVLSAWKQRMEETEKEKSKPKEGPPAEIDIYGSTDNATEAPTSKLGVSQVASVQPAEQVTVKEKKTEIAIEKPVMVQRLAVSPKISVESPETKPVIIDTKPLVRANSPKIFEKSKTLGSSFRNPEKPTSFTITSMESNTLPRQKSFNSTMMNNAVNKPKDTVDSNKLSHSNSTVEISSDGGSLEDRKRFFQGIKPVENNGKEAPIPATNMKSNIAAIQKVFEKQRMTKMQQMGSQQSLHSDGTISPVPSLQRNDSLESRQSTLRRQNSVESHSSDSSSVVLRVSQNTTGKASPQLATGTEMVQKLFGRPNTMNNFDPLRRTPSPISSTTSTLSSSTSYERFTPSPTVVDGPNNSIRISTGGYKPPNQSSNIRSVGNKAIIIVNGEDNATRNGKAGTANDNIVITSSSNIKKSPMSNSYMSSVVQQQQQQKQLNKRESVPPSSTPVSQLKQNIAISNSFLKKTPTVNEPTVVSQKNDRNTSQNGTGVPPPPPPPPVDGLVKVKSQLSLDVKKSANEGNMRNSKSSTPTSPMSPSDPRAEICNAIKNSNGNFGLRKTGSSILLK